MSKKLPAIFLKEIYEKDQKYFTVYDTYTPNYNRTEITGKFYSKYDSLIGVGEYPELVEKIKAVQDRGPKEKLKWPETTNQSYGWYTVPLVEIDRNDYRLYFPQKSSEMTRHQIKLAQGASKRGR
ncbi:hypothetical protein NQ315_017254 [Exocentrus adspersus]|uniref:Uncharacterized protein n=1 Tax=Exocentrus adspersus TaxID=1586481 RepID=A0AAV8VFD0_9CUCU|nr:hypothetical protein NQ315_017254 [Exocentrus adspersus]